MKRRSVMIQGTASSVGKSILCTALCRILTQDGYNVSPFKSQNMSLNSYITHEGYEMGRAQVMQAEACGKVPKVEMNPILLKPTTDRKSQVILKGVVAENMDAPEYFKYKPRLREMVKSIYYSLLDNNDIIVIEGAGSPAEINLKSDDIVNMGMAKMANSPVILVADIDKGGVFASIYGTIMLLDEDERSMIKGIIINKFRGSVELLKPGLKQIEELVNIPVLGVIPYFNLNLEDEDSVTNWSQYSDNPMGDLDIAILKLPKISNFTDFNALRMHNDVKLRFVDIDKPMALGNPDMIIIPGSKNTIEDLEAIKKTGIDKEILKAHKNGSNLFGICGGFQMLGQEILDLEGVESTTNRIDGLALLPVITEFQKSKATTLSQGTDCIFNTRVKGYEIHMGRTKNLNDMKPLIRIEERTGLNSPGENDGAVNGDLTIFGTYLHGIFDNAEFTRNLLNNVRKNRDKEIVNIVVQDFWDHKEQEFDKLADILRHNLDMEAVYKILEEGIND